MSVPQRAALIVVSLAAVLVGSGHIGSPEVWYEGPAGPYSVRVRVRPPQVVPGLAEVSVRVRGGAERVTIAPARSDTGVEGQPAPDQARRQSHPEVFETTVWIMARGAYRIVVSVDGARGRGVAIVPVTAQATVRRPMSRATSWALLAAALFLYAGMVSIIGAAVRESVLPPGQMPSADRRQRARRAMAGGAVLILLVLFGGWRWWNRVDQAHRAALDRPWQVQAVAHDDGVLRFSITDSVWVKRNQLVRRLRPDPIVPDHGKLMHMFLIRADQQAFAHVHPETKDQNLFSTRLPRLPAGEYRVYADVVHESGYTRTLATALRLQGPTAGGAGHADDASWSLTEAARPETTFRWLGPAAAVAGAEVELAIELVDATGTPVAPEPYMGMPAHAVVEKENGGVFIHLHPLGTISPSAQQAVARRAMTVTLPHARAGAGRISFPYAFPQPGRYSVWVQARRGAVLTARFTVDVRP